MREARARTELLAIRLMRVQNTAEAAMSGNPGGQAAKRLAETLSDLLDQVEGLRGNGEDLIKWWKDSRGGAGGLPAASERVLANIDAVAERLIARKAAIALRPISRFSTDLPAQQEEVAVLSADQIREELEAVLAETRRLHAEQEIDDLLPG